MDYEDIGRNTDTFYRILHQCLNSANGTVRIGGLTFWAEPNACMVMGRRLRPASDKGVMAPEFKQRFIEIFNKAFDKYVEMFFENPAAQAVDDKYRYVAIAKKRRQVFINYELVLYVKGRENGFLSTLAGAVNYSKPARKIDKHEIVLDMNTLSQDALGTRVRKYVEFQRTHPKLTFGILNYDKRGKRLCFSNEKVFDYQKRYVFEKANPSAKEIADNYLRNTFFCTGKVNVWLRDGGGYHPSISLWGDAKNIKGDITNICGKIHPDLCGDISGLRGDISNLYGDATGIKFNITEEFEKPTNVKTLGKYAVPKDFKLLTNEENQILMKVWNTLAHHTIGVTDEERKLFDNPVKCQPPFDVDRWGRAYRKLDNDRLIVYSVNPADILLAKDVNKCSTCFCLNSGREKWTLGMRCLIALNSVNPNFGVAFVIKKDSVKKLNQFNGIKFKWYDPTDACYFHFTPSELYLWYGAYLNKLTNNTINYAHVKRIYGHDGHNDGHGRQAELAYLETFIKKDYRWYRGKDEDFPLCNNTKDFKFDDLSEDWKRQIEIANAKAKELKELLGKE